MIDPMKALKGHIIQVDSVLGKYNVSVKSLKWLGGGNNGTAFHSPEENSRIVVKVTKDKKEMQMARLLKGRQFKGVAEIYEVFNIDDLHGVIIVEKVLIDDLIRNSVYFITEVSGDHGFMAQDLIKECHLEDILSPCEKFFLNEPCDSQSAEMLKAAFIAKKEIMSVSYVEPEDLHFFNIGMRKNGSFVFLISGNFLLPLSLRCWYNNIIEIREFLIGKQDENFKINVVNDCSQLFLYCFMFISLITYQQPDYQPVKHWNDHRDHDGNCRSCYS